MKKILLACVIVASAMSMMVNDVEARRLGGGGSFGRQSPNVSRQMPQQSQAARPAPAAAPAAASPGMVPPKPASPWRGIVGGALAGLGIAALMSHFGMGGAMGSMLGSLLMFGVLAMVLMFIYRLFQNRNGNRPAYQSAYGAGPGAGAAIGSRLEPRAFQDQQPAAFQAPAGAQTGGAAPWGVPADFDATSFLRNAKTYFIRLQAAWDKADINDIREFTSPEMYAELRLQLQERGATPNHTDVVVLNAELLGLETVGNDYLASVKFSGSMKESTDAVAEPFAEVWNMAKPLSGATGWVLAGIQQIS